MPAYIQDVETLLFQARNIVLPPEQEIGVALRALSHSPVAEYAAFTANEARLIAAYRIFLAPVGRDEIWENILAVVPEAWAYAIHEAAELQAFADLNANPFEAGQFERALPEAHLRATAMELRFLNEWARQMQVATSEFAIESTNPLRSQFRSHRIFLERLRARWDYPLPNEAERDAAHEFWKRILKGEE